MVIPLLTLFLKRTYRLLWLSGMSLFISGFLLGVIITFTDSIDSYIQKEGKTLVGGDIILSSPYPLDRTVPLLQRLEEQGLIFSETRSFQGVFTTSSGDVLAAQIRAVDNLFPLYGEVVIDGEKTYTKSQNSLYAEKTFLTRLGVKEGDVVSFAGKEFRIEGILSREPDSLSLGVSFAPKVLVLLSDIEAIDVPLSESRTRYRLLIKDEAGTILTREVRQEIISYAQENRIRFDDAIDGPNNLLEGVGSVDDFISIILAVALFLVVINIGANLSYLLATFRKTLALFKINGARNTTLRTLFITMFGGLGFIAGSIGAYCGVYAGRYILSIVRDLYVIDVLPGGVLVSVVFGGLFGTVLIIVAALPFLRLVNEVEPKELLASTSSFKHAFSLQRSLLYLPIPFFVGVALYSISQDVYISLFGVLGCIILFIFFMGCMYVVLRGLYRVRNRFSFIIRSSISFLYLRKAQTLISSAAIMTAFSLVFVIAAIEVNIENNLTTNIRTTAPDLYLIDITKSQLDEVRSIAGDTFVEYPIVRGRLLFFNERDLVQEDNRELRREFNLTYRDSLIEGEEVVEGTLGDTFNGSVQVPVSIDKAFGEELGGVSLGDTITIFIQGVELTATVTSIREVNSRSGIPFFYLVFPTYVLERFPATFFGTVQVDEITRDSIERKIATTFPNIIPIVTSSVIDTVTSLVTSIVQIVVLVSIPGIALGLLLIIVMLAQNMYERKGDVLVLRAFGMTRRGVMTLFIIEGALLVTLASVLSYLIAHGVAFILNTTLFSFTLFSFTIVPIWIALAVLLFVVIFGFFLSRHITQASLKKLLAEK